MSGHFSHYQISEWIFFPFLKQFTQKLAHKIAFNNYWHTSTLPKYDKCIPVFSQSLLGTNDGI